MTDSEQVFDGLGVLFNYHLGGDVPVASRAPPVKERRLEDVTNHELDALLQDAPEGERMVINRPDGSSSTFSMQIDEDDMSMSTEDLSGIVPLPVGLTVLVLEDEPALRELYMGTFNRVLTKDAFEDLGLPGMYDVEIIGYDSVPVAVDHFRDNANKYQNRIVAASIDLNLRGASDETKEAFTHRMARDEVLRISPLKRRLYLEGLEGNLLEKAEAIKQIIAGSGPAYDDWVEDQVKKAAKKYEGLVTTYGNRVVGELLGSGVKLVVADINSAEDLASIRQAVEPIVNQSRQGYFPLATSNPKTSQAPGDDAERLAYHILQTTSDVLRAVNQPDIAEFVNLTKVPDERK